MPRRSALALLVAIGLSVPTGVHAQTIEATPIVGMYVPIGALVDVDGLADAPLLRKRNIGTLLVGLRSGVLVGPHVGVEVSLAYTPSMVAVTDAVSTIDRGAGVLLLGIRTPFFINGESWAGPWQFSVAPGAGLVKRHGEVWSGYEGTTDLAAILAFGARIGGPTSRVHVRLDVEDYLSWAQFQTPSGDRARSLLHHDLVWSMGVAIPVGGR